MATIKGPQFETQVFPLLSALALRNDLRKQYLNGDYSNLKAFDQGVLDACKDIVNDNQAAFVGVYGTMVQLQTNASDDSYDPDDCPTNKTIAGVVGFLNQPAPAAAPPGTPTR